MGTAVAVVVIMTTCMSMTLTVTLVMSVVIVLAMTMATSLRGEGVLPYIGYTGMCCWKGCGFQAIYSEIETSNHRKLI